MDKINKDVQLLYACLKGKANPEDVSSIDWPAFFRLAERHKVQSLLYSRLADHRSIIPPEIIVHMKNLVTENSLRAVQQLAMLQEIKKTLAEIGIEFVLLKGLSFSTMYGGTNDRHVGDLDILVQNDSSLWKTVSVLIEKYDLIVINGPLPVTTGKKREFLKYRKDVELFSPALNLTIEVHSRLFLDAATWDMKTSDIWLRKRKVLINADEFHVLGKDDMIRHILIHGAICCWFRLKWVMDMEVIATREANSDKSEFLKYEGSVLQRVLLLRERLMWSLGTTQKPLSENSTALMIRLMANVIAREVNDNEMAQASGKYTGIHAFLRSFSIVVYQGFLTPGIYSKIAGINRVFYSPSETEFLNLPDGFLFLYTPLRPLFYILKKMGLPRTSGN